MGRPYIVYMGHVAQTDAAEDHHNLLLNVIGDKKVARQSKIYSYCKSFNAFAANLLPREADLLKDMKGVISVFPSTTRKLHTTRSWDFVGLPQVRKETHDTIQSNIIIGLLDIGIYTTSLSFKDEGYRPPPAKWKGTCDHGANFMGCNNMVIGSRWYRIHSPKVDDVITNTDYVGHGTHTSSTAAGSPVENANFYDLAKGTARGAVFDDAIHDGVDIISLSLGGSPQLYFQDAIAIGSFHADWKGIVMTCSAGNAVLAAMSISNLAPWVLTVIANGVDRSF
ncbi:hypothetical protein GIB67_021958 [Kingdonia uniflora]|uniref:Cucumisin n=1 Tax=Kingdonia uniflora TaxID=39325 RepID=A0A7J7P8G7_9MAGN|nr:hypothetical protein GIB67_021958 [Kingdonia uniflora]